ncbi:MAG: Holliday junction resolvase RuvX [Planctomycetales bacterium]|nr:Holliday junction resolvase RuvX [Planctomycetales bacterium]
MSEPTLPKQGRLAGIDYGTVRVGVAICDPERRLASPYENYNRRNEKLDAEYFRKLAANERLVGFVVGLPVHTSGDESGKSFEARQYGAWLQQTTGLPVAFHDERYTSTEAESMLMVAGHTKKRRKKRLDAIAAQLILAAYLESSGRQDSATQALWDDRPRDS